MTRSILITGCSTGIGHHAAHALSARGWQVFAACRKAEDCDRLRSEGLLSPRIDYEEPNTIASGLTEVLEVTGGRLDALFNNGAYAIPGLVEDLPTDALRTIFEANFFGWHDLTRRCLPVMRAQGHGRIVQNSSVLGFAAAPWRGAYNASKFALEGLTDTLRMELRGTGIAAILIEPGPITSRFRANARDQFEKWIDWKSSARRADYERLMDRLYSNATGRFERGPEAVTRALIHAVESSRPRARYRVTVPTTLAMAMKRALTTKAADRVVSNS
ncbi:SDR family NAD(P)-dependent oxidoreductase [Jannaschia rubra]|uniref:D-beta-hydroxybutyrate dehydrogenase n=1 Tax=Jannaschia rubra TaxID=282197 RepID=A0A0M6XLX3_9RHOB|nr:SDR family NAD(P)-dependent oxidoreductase [Jannaschia rubra]CTQ31928.1 D-beta-hydroxybutyrate dehydrogenase [Jannaschia rubra]SFG41852.1 Short-chain dehydrogenase [Jannaschia rubra]